MSRYFGRKSTYVLSRGDQLQKAYRSEKIVREKNYLFILVLEVLTAHKIKYVGEKKNSDTSSEIFSSSKHRRVVRLSSSEDDNSLEEERQTENYSEFSANLKV